MSLKKIAESLGEKRAGRGTGIAWQDGSCYP